MVKSIWNSNLLPKAKYTLELLNAPYSGPQVKAGTERPLFACRR